jgi:DNA-directed RNA polymerase subunit H (RpoH/RPB5)
MNTLEEQIILSRKTLIEMLTDRGYITSNIVSELPDTLFEQLWSTFTNESNIFDIECENNIGNRIYVTYIRNHILSKKKKNKKIVSLQKIHKNLLQTQDLLRTDNILYVICDTQSEQVLETYEEFLKKNKNVELFDIKRLLFNITKHYYVPKHTLLNKKKVQLIKNSLQISSIYKLPVISHTDPVARYYNLKRGDVVQITRVSPSYGKHITYRVCSDIEE